MCASLFINKMMGIHSIKVNLYSLDSKLMPYPFLIELNKVMPKESLSLKQPFKFLL